MKTIHFLHAFIIVSALILPQTSSAKLKVVTTTTDLACLVRQVGGDLVEVSAIASAAADLHYVEARPSFIVKLKSADAAFKIGLELDVWMNKLIDASRNGALKIFDCGSAIHALEIPTGTVDASLGDLHRFGNPHYWLSPGNISPLAQFIAHSLGDVDPGAAATYQKNCDAFLLGFDAEMSGLKQLAEKMHGVDIMTYHNSLPYFADYFGITVVGYIEKYPGVAPSASRVAEVVALIKSRRISIIAMEPFLDRRIADKIARDSGARVVIMYQSIGGRTVDESLVDFYRGNLLALIGEGTGGK